MVLPSTIWKHAPLFIHLFGLCMYIYIYIYVYLYVHVYVCESTHVQIQGQTVTSAPPE